MATSGSFTTNEYNSSSGKKKGLRFHWERTNYSISENWSEISWTWKGESSNSSSGYHLLRSSYLNVNGSRVYTQGSGSKELYDGTTVASGTTKIYHNADGTKSFSADGGGAIYLTSVNCTGSNSWTLDTIPRYANITSFSVSKRDETSVTFNWSADASCDYAWYSTDNGSNWSALPSNNVVGGLSANTGYNFKLRVRRTDSQLTTDSGTYYQETYDYPKPTSINNFSIGDGASVNLYNPLGRNVTLQILQVNTNTVLGTYTGTYQGVINAEFKTTDAINRQYQSIPNSNSGTYYAKVTYGNITKTKGNATYSTKVNECSPTFTTFTYQDSNSDITSITGDNQVFVKGYSTLQVNIASANKMTTQKYATPSSYSISCDTLNDSVAYSTNDITKQMGTIANSGSLRLNVRAYDSRGNSALAYQDITVYDYTKPVINIDVSRLNNFENETTLKVAGTYTKLTINNTDKNTITNVKYRYREAGGTWSSWTNITTTVSNGSFTCSDVILSLDNTKSFEFEVQATDRIDNNTNSSTVDIGQAVFFISSNNRACYINGQEILMYDVVDTW